MSVRSSNTAQNTVSIGQNEVSRALNFKVFHLVRVISELQALQAALLTHPHSTQTFSAEEVCTCLLSIEIRESHDHLLIGLTFVSV